MIPQEEVRGHYRPAARFGLLWLGLVLVDIVILYTFPWAKAGSARTDQFGLLAVIGLLLVIAGYGLQLEPIARNIGLTDPVAGSADYRFWRLYDQGSLTFVFLSEFFAIVACKRLILTYSQPNILTDTMGYLQVAGISPTQTEFWMGQRPWTVPLLYRLLGATSSATASPQLLSRVVLFQGALSAIAWLLLAAAVASTSRFRWLRPVLFGIVGIFGLSLHVSQWDTIVLSESISTSLLIIVIALGVLSLRGSDKHGAHLTWKVLLIAPALVLYSFSRDANAYFILLAGFVLAIITTIQVVRTRTMPWLKISLIGLAVLVFAGQQVTIQLSGRSRAPFYGMFLQRVLLEPDRIPWFQEAGMPLGTWWDGMDRSIERVAFYQEVTTDPDAAPFVHWMDRRGRATYLRYWLSHPVEAIRLPLTDAGQLLSPDSTEYRGDGAATPGWLRLLSAVFFPLSDEALLLMGAGIALAILMLKRLKSSEKWWNVPLGLLGLSVPMMFLVWHGDSIEIERHAFQIALQIRLGFWLLVAAVANAYIGSWLFKTRPAPERTPEFGSRQEPPPR